MPLLARRLIIALISLLLPLQTSLASARAVSMAAANTKTLTVTMRAIAVEGKPPAIVQSEPAPSARHDEHAGHAHHLSDRAAVLATPSLAIKAPAHPASHQQSGNACDSVAKCCFTGAAAPPTMWLQSASAVAARVIFTPSSDPLSVFVPDGPERPPRCL